MPIYNPNLPYAGRFSYLNPAAGSAGNWAGSATGTPNPAEFPTIGQLPDDQPVYEPTLQAFINKRTNRVWTGALPGGNYAFQGKLAPAPGGTSTGTNGLPFNPADRYKAIEIPKNVDIDAANNGILGRYNANAADEFKGFDAHLKAASAGADAAYRTGQAATDTTGFETNLRGATDRYGRALTGDAADYANLNAADAATQREIVARQNALLPEYDAAGNAIADRQLQLATARVNRYKLGTGTPRSLGGDELALQNQAAADVMLPLKQAQINQRYALLNNEANVESGITGRETSRIAQFNPSIQAAQFNSQADAEKAIQNLRMAAAGQQWQNVAQMLQQPALAAEVRNRIQMGDTQLLAAITALRGQNRYQSAIDTQPVNLSQPVGYNLQTPGYPSAGRYGGGGGTVNTAGGPLVTPGATDPVSQAQMDKLNASLAVDPKTGLPLYASQQRALISAPSRYAQPQQNFSYGAQSNSHYDPARGAFVDNTTGLITGYGSDMASRYGNAYDPYGSNMPAYD